MFPFGSPSAHVRSAGEGQIYKRDVSCVVGKSSSFFATGYQLHDNLTIRTGGCAHRLGCHTIMFRLSRSARRSLFICAALLGLLSIIHSNAEGEGGTPAARIPSGSQVASLSRVSAATKKPARRKDLLIGDASLRGDLDMTTLFRVEDHYEVKLSDGSFAVLTLDPTAQEAAEKVLRQAKAPKGAVVIMATDGRILAMAGRSQAEDKAETIDSSLALSVWAPAASVFKIVTTAALLSAGVDPKEKICYHGGLRSVDKSNLVDNPRTDHACNDLGFAIAKSQNALIAKLAHRYLDKKTLRAMASSFGFDAKPSFALDAEAGRLELPDDPLEFAKVAAGFWSSEISALNGASLSNVIASGGMMVSPRIVAEIRESDRVIKVVSQPGKRVLSKEAAHSVAAMMQGTIDHGTGFKGFHDSRGRPFLGDTKVAGKTGSLSRNTPSYLAYSWFVGMAPVEKPDLVVSVLLGNSALWHLKAHTAARLVLDSIY